MSSFKSNSSSLESLVRIAVANGELAPGVAAQINRYRTGKLTCEEHRLLAILDDAIADGCIAPIEMNPMSSRRQATYRLS
ncbi:MAG: hypothetical protein WBC73_01005 [Phormidesmis sp.]